MNKKINNKEKELYNTKLEEKLNDIYELSRITEGKLDDKIYTEISNTLLKYSEILKKNYVETLPMYNFLEQYIELSSKLIIKYNKNNNDNINYISNFINLYVNENLDYKYYIFNEFKNLGIIEERFSTKIYKYNLFKKVLQVLSATYREDNNISPKLMYEKSKIGEIQQKSKEIIGYIITLNKKSMLANQIEVIKPTTTVMEIVSYLPDFIADNENDFKQLMDWLYKLFWDNTQKIRDYDINKDLNIINLLRTYYYHDIDHGDASEIRRKFRKVKDFYKESCGKFIPETAKDWQKVQEYIYDKLILFLSDVEIKEKIEVVS